MNGVKRSLVDTIRLNLISQMSDYVANALVDQTRADAVATGGSQSLVAGFISRITSELSGTGSGDDYSPEGSPPIIAITPAGHSILAYNVESDGNGGYFIDGYNPNDPVDSSSSGTHPIYDISNPSNPGSTNDTYIVQTEAGMRAEDNQDRIHITAQGGWSWMQNNGTVYSGDLAGGGLQVYGVSIYATQHNTPYVGPAGTMTLPGPGSGVLGDTETVVLGDVLLNLAEDILPFLNGSNSSTSAGASSASPLAASSSNPAVSSTVVGVSGTTASSASASSPSAGLPIGPLNPALADLALEMNGSAQDTDSGSTWWVGSARGSNFADIQSAISSELVQSGDTLKVEPGTYSDAGFANDTLTVNKSLTIIGGQQFPNAHQHGPSGPSIVTSDGVGFTLDADNISIQQFTVRPATLPLGAAGIATEPDYLAMGYQIQGNILEDERNGLYMNSVLSNSTLSSTVSGNSFKDDTDGIFSDLGMSNVTISKNSFTGDTSASVAVYGLSKTIGDDTDSLDAPPLASNVQIINNYIIDDAAIILQDATNSKIEGNQIVDPAGANDDGIWLDGRVTSTEVADNTLHGSPGRGNGIESSGAGNSNDAISRNTVLDFNDGILLAATVYGTVSQNTIKGSTANGIELTDHSANNTIVGNSANDNFSGLLLLASDSNTVSQNTVSHNLNVGIEVAGSNHDMITGNRASFNHGAIGIVVFIGDSNTVSGNTANYDSIGIESLDSTNTTTSNNTTKHNHLD
jgi:parallel beta-helix repeat protein